MGAKPAILAGRMLSSGDKALQILAPEPKSVAPSLTPV